jgi:hypothetical protein
VGGIPFSKSLLLRPWSTGTQRRDRAPGLEWTAGLGQGFKRERWGKYHQPHQQEATAVVQVLDQGSVQSWTPCAERAGTG